MTTTYVFRSTTLDFLLKGKDRDLANTLKLLGGKSYAHNPVITVTVAMELEVEFRRPHLKTPLGSVHLHLPRFWTWPGFASPTHPGHNQSNTHTVPSSLRANSFYSQC